MGPAVSVRRWFAVHYAQYMGQDSAPELDSGAAESVVLQRLAGEAG